MMGNDSNDQLDAILETALMHVKETLRLQKGELALVEWLHLVQRVKKSTLRHPQKLLPENVLIVQHLDKRIEEQFFQFLKEEILSYES